MRRIMAMALVLMCVCACALSEQLLVGMECNYAPYNWTQAEASEYAVAITGGGYADGYDVQVAKIIAEKLGRELVIVKTEWDGLPMGLMSGKLDAVIAGMSPTAERKLSIDFTAPYYTSDLVIVVRKDSLYASATTLNDFAGAKITGQLNTFHYSVIDQLVGAQKMTAMDTFPAMVVALTARAIDGYISERPGAISAMESNDDLTFVSFEAGQGFVTSEEDTAISVGLKQGSDLLDPINEILAQITAQERQQLMDEAIARQPLNEQ